MLDTLTLASFEPLVGQTFEAVLDADVVVPLTMFQATALKSYEYPGQSRAPFQLRFKGPATHFLQQQIYPLRNPALGAVTIFLVPIGQEADGYVYQAVFN